MSDLERDDRRACVRVVVSCNGGVEVDIERRAMKQCVGVNRSFLHIHAG